MGHPQLLLAPATAGLCILQSHMLWSFLECKRTYLSHDLAVFGLDHLFAPDAAIENFSKLCMEHVIARFWVHAGISLHIQWSFHLPFGC